MSLLSSLLLILVSQSHPTPEIPIPTHAEVADVCGTFSLEDPPLSPSDFGDRCIQFDLSNYEKVRAEFDQAIENQGWEQRVRREIIARYVRYTHDGMCREFLSVFLHHQDMPETVKYDYYPPSEGIGYLIYMPLHMEIHCSE